MMKTYLKKSLLFAAAALTGLTTFGQGSCNEFSYFYSDINYPDGVKQSDIYSVALEDGAAILSPITLDLAYGAHIAFDSESGLLVLINDANGGVQTLDPVTGILSEVVMPESSLSGVVTSGINADGKHLVGSGNGNIYDIDLSTNPYGVELFDDGADISGGDLTFTDAGLYLASKPLGYLYGVIPGFDNVLLGSVDGNVTGMATYEDESSVIVSSRGNDSFLVYEVSLGVIETGSYAAELDGEPFSLDNGDMASGCTSRNNSIEGCEDFKTYYIHDELGGGQDVLYSVQLNEMGGADMTEIAEVAPSSHIGVGPDGLLYIVAASSKVLTVMDPLTADVLDQVQIVAEGGLGSIPAVVVGDDGTIYIGSANDKIYTVDAVSGAATYYGEANVSGGDLLILDGVLWLANRGQNRFYEVNGEGQFDVAATEINGASVLPNGNILVANGDLNSLMEVYEPYTGDATGETFNTGLTLYNGDLGSRCFDDESSEECENYKVYLSNNSPGTGHLYEVTLDDDAETASLSLLRDDLPKSHIALAPNGLVYLIARTGSVATYDPATDDLSAYLPLTINGNNIGGTHSGVVTADGTFYVGSSSADKVYEVDINTGIAMNPIDAPVQGADLIQTQDGDLWLINRPEKRFYNLTDGVSEYDVDLGQIYGAAVLQNGMILAGTANTNSLQLIDPETQAPTGASYAMDLQMGGGDMAGGCVSGGGDVTPDPGNCYASEIIEYAPGLENDDDMIPAERTDGNQALGEPERSDVYGDYVFASLGYSEDGGSITLGFDGMVPNMDGDDLEIVETTWGNPSCGNEYADVYVSMDGVDYAWAKTVCRADAFVDISDAGDFAYIMYVKIVQGEASTTSDGYDVDGVVALHNCDEEQGEELPEGGLTALDEESINILTAYPNPSEGLTNVVFSTSNDEYATVQIIDMNGRVVETLFSQMAQANVEYRLDFNGLALPNGIYLTKLVTNSDTQIEKLMISK